MRAFVGDYANIGLDLGPEKLQIRWQLMMVTYI